MTIADSDFSNYVSARDSTHKDLLVYAARKSGRSPLQIQRDFGQLAKSHGKLNMVEYVRNGLYDLDRFTADERAQFISNDLHWPITHKCNNKGWVSAAEDKVVAATMLAAGGVPIPDTVAVFDMSSRLFPGLRKINSSDSLTALLEEHSGQRLFCKIMEGMVSFGAFRIESGDADHIICSGHPAMSHEQFFSEFIGGNSYVVQREIRAC